MLQLGDVHDQRVFRVTGWRQNRKSGTGPASIHSHPVEEEKLSL